MKNPNRQYSDGDFEKCTWCGSTRPLTALEYRNGDGAGTEPRLVCTDAAWCRKAARLVLEDRAAVERELRDRIMTGDEVRRERYE